jgi:hypothetical protein
MSAKTYADQVVEITQAIQAKAKEIQSLEKSHHDWTRPGGTSVHIGHHTYIVRQDGTINPLLAGVHREILAAIDNRLHTLHGELEGLRFKLVKLGREGGAR